LQLGSANETPNKNVVSPRFAAPLIFMLVSDPLELRGSDVRRGGVGRRLRSMPNFEAAGA
jgi:hypothetical protein